MNYNNNNNNGLSILLVLIAFMIISSMSSSSAFLMYDLFGSLAVKPSAETQGYIDAQDRKADAEAKKYGLDADEIRKDVRDEYRKACLIGVNKDGKCPDTMKPGKDGCCVFKDPKTQSDFEKGMAITSQIVEVVLVSVIAEAVIVSVGNLLTRGALAKAGTKVATKTAAKAGARVASRVGTKAATSIGTRLATKLSAASKCGPYCVAAMIAFEVFSLTLDLTDPFGYNNFQANEIIRNQRNFIDVELQKQNPSMYPLTFPLSAAFPEFDQEFTQVLTGEMLADALKLLDQEILVKFLTASLGGDSSMSSDVEKALEVAFDKAMENTKRRDKVVYDFYKSKGKEKHIEMVSFLSNKDRIGVTLSQYGAEQYNKRMKSEHLKYSNPFKPVPSKIPDEYTPFVAMYTDTYRVLNATDPGEKYKPNVSEKKLPKKVCLAMPYGGLIANCEYGMKSSKHSQRLNPSTYGVKFSYDRGDCDFTSEYCRRVGLDFKDNDCKMNAGQKYAEMIFGTTVTRTVKTDWQNRIDAWKSGDPAKIAVATAATALSFTPIGLAVPFVGKLVSAIKDTYGRGVGTVPNRCGPDKEKKGALCYPKCRPGYKSRALECEGTCPPGSRNTGLTCLHGIHSYIPGNKCSNPFRKCFYQRKPCREGFRYRGTTCNRECKPGFKFRSGALGTAFCDKPRNRYSRAGKPAPMDCPPGKVKDAGLCYKPCKEGYTGNGPTCKKVEESKQVNIYDV